jgi:hypothetical protein
LKAVNANHCNEKEKDVVHFFEDNDEKYVMFVDGTELDMMWSCSLVEKFRMKGYVYSLLVRTLAKDQ